ncbi:MAG: patatin-like phospholipase family protein, partial [Syntrophales bacterium]|nr:patatin-like phospholipase family protein [Syntrophales bacterium]
KSNALSTKKVQAMTNGNDDLALVLGGGGAHAAYQVGFLRCLAYHFPHLRIPILTGISAGSINATFIANHQGTFKEAIDALSDIWCNLTVEQVYDVKGWSLTKSLLHWGIHLLSGGLPNTAGPKAFVDTSPLRKLLEGGFTSADNQFAGIRENIREQKLKALAITATNYSTGQAVTWVQGQNIAMWERPDRHSVMTDITVEQIMASTALPIFFPAVRIGDCWFGDGGIRQYAPLSPSLHLGARRIMAVSTRHRPSLPETESAVHHRYPSIALIMDVLMNAIFVDMLDQDLLGLDRVNKLLHYESRKEASNLRLVRAFTLRPNVNLGKMAGTFEPNLPRPFRFLTRRLGTQKTESFDWLSMIMFDSRYIQKLIEIGEADAYARKEEIAAFLA